VDAADVDHVWTSRGVGKFKVQASVEERPDQCSKLNGWISAYLGEGQSVPETKKKIQR
jgi:hypothetical protein